MPKPGRGSQACRAHSRGHTAQLYLAASICACRIHLAHRARRQRPPCVGSSCCQRWSRGEGMAIEQALQASTRAMRTEAKVAEGCAVYGGVLVIDPRVLATSMMSFHEALSTSRVLSTSKARFPSLARLISFQVTIPPFTPARRRSLTQGLTQQLVGIRCTPASRKGQSRGGCCSAQTGRRTTHRRSLCRLDCRRLLVEATPPSRPTTGAPGWP